MIALDTHALIWWVNGDNKLSSAAKKAISKIQKNASVILVSSITVWEIALLVKKRRLTLTMDVSAWIATTAAIDSVRYVAIDNAIAIESVNLPGNFHKDPADRMITAMARHHNVPLLTADERIRNYNYVKTIW
ncbi:MAG: type II toxin-antitoxin system VapC family toxin [Thiohalomonadales bacterium]